MDQVIMSQLPESENFISPKEIPQPVNELYTIIGEDGPNMERTKAAIDWLLSPEAKGIGEKLFRDAYAMAGKPLFISVDDWLFTGYANFGGQHTIYFSPSFIEKLLFRSEDGLLFPLSIEACLGHELKHAGQEFARDAALFEQISENKERMIAASRDSEKIKQIRLYVENAQNTSYKPIAKQQAKKAIKKGIEMGLEALEKLKTDPHFIVFLKTIEEPAVIIESEIQHILGLPVRRNYLDIASTVQQLRRTTDEVNGSIKWDEKKDMSFWRQFVKHPKKITLGNNEKFPDR